MGSPLNRSIKASIRRQVNNDKQLNLQARQIIEKQFKVIRDNMLNDFETHSVTRELSGGPSASNATNSLPEGNLFGFIGFDSGADPVSGIRKLLSSTEIYIKRRRMGQFGFIWTYLITSPSLKDLYSVTPLPWANGASWLRELEGRGIPNLGQYMHKRIPSSRSGAGFQNSRRSAGGRLKIPYVKQILMDFEKKLNSIEASRVSRANF